MRLSIVAALSLVFAVVAVAAPPRAHVGARATTLGAVLTDARGHTLYAFDRGTACTGECLSTWPALLTAGKPIALAGVTAAKLGTVKRSDGTLQAAFAGKPLYLYAGDAKAGQTNGASIAHWAAVSKSGARLRASATTTPPTTTMPYDPGGGY